MDLVQAQHYAQKLSDQQLSAEMNNQNGQIPPFVILSELQRRQAMRQDALGSQNGNLPSMAQEAQMRAMGMPTPPDPKPQQNMATGGLLSLLPLYMAGRGQGVPDLSSVLGQASSSGKLQPPNPMSPPQQRQQPGPIPAALPPLKMDAGGLLSLNDTDVDLLTRIAQAEAGQLGEKGREAVAATVLNRMASGKFPNTVSGVVGQKGQFEPVANYGGVDKLPAANPNAVAQMKSFLANYSDPTNGATYFLNPVTTGQRGTSFPSVGKVNPTLVQGSGSVEHAFYDRFSPDSPVTVPPYQVALNGGTPVAAQGSPTSSSTPTALLPSNNSTQALIQQILAAKQQQPQSPNVGIASALLQGVAQQNQQAQQQNAQAVKAAQAGANANLQSRLSDQTQYNTPEQEIKSLPTQSLVSLQDASAEKLPSGLTRADIQAELRRRTMGTQYMATGGILDLFGNTKKKSDGDKGTQLAGLSIYALPPIADGGPTGQLMPPPVTQPYPVDPNAPIMPSLPSNLLPPADNGPTGQNLAPPVTQPFPEPDPTKPAGSGLPASLFDPNSTTKTSPIAPPTAPAAAAPSAPVQKPLSFEDQLAKIKGLMGNNGDFATMLQQIKAAEQPQGLTQQDKLMALARLGFGMAASHNTSFAGSLGEGALAGLQGISDSDKQHQQAVQAAANDALSLMKAREAANLGAFDVAAKIYAAQLGYATKNASGRYYPKDIDAAYQDARKQAYTELKTDPGYAGEQNPAKREALIEAKTQEILRGTIAGSVLPGSGRINVSDSANSQ